MKYFFSENIMAIVVQLVNCEHAKKKQKNMVPLVLKFRF